jgi:hypothetical protein
MDTKLLSQLILYIVSKVQDLGGYTTTIRLVKFLFLIDLEHQRRFGRTLTGLRWIYYHYGPYAFELLNIGERIGFDLQREEFVTTQRYKGFRLRAQEYQNFPHELGFAAEALVNGILSVWAEQDTADLLHYVYHTEPMKQAQRGETLDLSLGPQETRYYEIHVPIDESVATRLRESLRSYAAEDSTEFVMPSTVHDDTLEAGLRALNDEEDSSFLELGGIEPHVDFDALIDTLPQED